MKTQSNDNKAASPSTESRLKKSSLFDATSSKSATAAMSEYVRKTRGLALKTLAIYLLPVKASVISKAIDLTVLQSVTLLNVGPQLQFWNMLSKENKTRPLPLHKIHTDNVTLPFLVCVAQLETVTELYLLERTQKARVESTAAKTTVTMEQIRKVALKKHAGTLKILVIRNESGSDWDLNAKTAVLLTRRSKLLEELAVSFGIKTMVSSTSHTNKGKLTRSSILSFRISPVSQAFVHFTPSSSALTIRACGSCGNFANSQSITSPTIPK